jgi:hypothetical protein
MKRKALAITVLGLAAILAATNLATARPVDGRYLEDSRGDGIPSQSLTAELGDNAFFAPVNGFAYHDHRLNVGIAIGVADDGIANDWTVHITNTSGQSWTNLFFVADLGATIGNADGRVEDHLGAPGVLTDAFHIDATGINANLLLESMTADGILQPGEQWEFAVMNFGTGAQSTPPVLITPDQFAGSSLLGPGGGLSSGNASILAVPAPVPEPATVGLMAVGAIALLMRRPAR